MSFKIEYMDLVRFIKAYGFNEFTATMIAEYIDECIDYEMDLSYYIWNTVNYNVAVLKGDNSVALQYINDNLTCDREYCIIYESERLGGVYIEWK